MYWLGKLVINDYAEDGGEELLHCILIKNP